VRFVGTPTKTIAKDLHATPSYPNLLPNPVLTMRFTIPILINLAFSNVASAQVCTDGGTACGYFGFLCCTGDEVCATDANNQAICSVPALSSSTPVVSMEIVSAMPTPTMVVSTNSVSATATSALTQATGMESSSSMSETEVGDASGSTTSASTLFSSAAQSADASIASSAALTTSAESTGSASASDVPASTTTGEGGRVGWSWYGLVGVVVGVSAVLMI